MKKALITTIFLMSGIWCLAQEKAPIEIIPNSMSTEIGISIGGKDDALGQMSISKNFNGKYTFSFGKDRCNAKIINEKLILQKPYILSYDTCKQTVTVVNTKLKTSYTIYWSKPTFKLTDLKTQ